MESKLTLKQEQELKCYFFSVRPANIVVAGEQGFYTLAYNESEAQAKGDLYVKENLGLPSNIKALAYGHIAITELLDKVKTDFVMPGQKVQPVKPAQPTEPQKYTKQQFFNSLKLVKDEFITESRDKATLERIINKYELDSKDTKTKVGK